MSLVICPECKHRISDKAKFCPYCKISAVDFLTGGKTADKSTKKSIKYPSSADNLIFVKEIQAILDSDRFIPENEANELAEKCRLKANEFKSTLRLNDSRINNTYYRNEMNEFLEQADELETAIEKHNREFVDTKLVEYKEYFDTILDKIDRNIFLDEDQRIAVLTDDDYCLIVAGAGSGKTTTMAAKTKYLVEKLGVPPDDIIVISYTNKAIRELKQRINVKLNIPVNVCTFHKFAFDLIRKNTYENPEVNLSAYGIIFEMLEKKIYKDRQFLKQLVLFLGFYFDLPENVFTYENLEQYHVYKANQSYQTLRSSLNEYIRKVSNLRSKKKRTLRGEFMRSVQEVQIANFLYMYNIDYEYEKVYDYPIMGATKKYTPDFFISQGENNAYIEHYGITQSHENNIYSKKQLQKYINAIGVKRDIHKHYKTELIETWSGYDDRRNLMVHLRQELTKRGFVLKQRDTKDVYRKIVETSKDKYVFKLIIFLTKFINLYKTNGYNEDGFDYLRSKTDNSRTRMFLDIAEKVYFHYQESLKKKNQIDFADMINDANFLLDEIASQNNKLKYKYIIIDEFQDIAKQRFNLTKKLADVTEAKVVAVGDDWQSIYAFAGSDITLFTRFKELMEGGRELKIRRTYRNSQELIDIAGGFIQKNTSQIRKRLISDKKIKVPIVIRVFDDSKSAFRNLAELVSKMIGEISEKHGERSTILLAGRYNYDGFQLTRTNLFYMSGNKIKCKKHPKTKLEFMTVHSAKGLGYDNVILINMFEGRYGFPCQIEDDPIMRLVIREDNSIDFAEERRLFYVALTRTRNRVYICAPKIKPSRFLIEIINDFNLPHPKGLNMKPVDHFDIRCPVCNFPLKYEFNKNYGLGLYICTNEPEICDFMTNDKVHRYDIYKCDKCSDGYMIVKRNNKNKQPFYGCSNYSNEDNFCDNAKPIKTEVKNDIQP